MRTGLLSLAILLPVVISAAPALAQPAAPTAPNALDAAPRCAPAAAPDTVVVCGRSDEQHRLPQQEGFDPSGTVMSVPLERFKLLDQGATGIGSCSTVGPGGWTGCDARRWHEQRLQWAGQRPGGGRRGVFVRVGPMQPR